MYKDIDKVAETMEVAEKVSKESVYSFALTCKAKSVHEFVCEWNKANVIKIQGDDVQGHLQAFEAEAKEAKEAEVLPVDSVFKTVFVKVK
jgi:hypothetical protein